MILRLAFRNVLRNKERSLLTLVGVVLAIGSFVALVSLAAGFTQRVERELESREVHLYLVGDRSSTLPTSPLSGAGGVSPLIPLELRDSLQSVAGVRVVTPVIRTAYDGPQSVIPVLAIPFENAPSVFKGARFSQTPRTIPQSTPVLAPEASPTPAATTNEDLKAEMASGTADTAFRVIVGQGLQRELGSPESAAGNLIINSQKYRIGAHMGGSGFLDYTILAPIESFFSDRPHQGVHEYWIALEDVGQLPKVSTEIESTITSFLNKEMAAADYAGVRSIRVLSRRQYLRSAKEYLHYGWLLQVAVAMVGVLIAVTASMNTMLMSTYERLGEYATLRAVGASRQVISLTILCEAIFLNVTGGVLGLVFGFLATGVLDRAVVLVLEIPYPMAGVTPALLLQALTLSACVGVVGAIIPCILVSRIDLVAQLRKGM